MPHQSQLSKSDHYLQCVQQPGEVMFVPQGMPHTVLNIGEAIGISMQEAAFHPPHPCPLLPAYLF